jgi:hypothetical protein
MRDKVAGLFSIFFFSRFRKLVISKSVSTSSDERNTCFDFEKRKLVKKITVRTKEVVKKAREFFGDQLVHNMTKSLDVSRTLLRFKKFTA